MLKANGYRAPTRGLLVAGGLATVAVAPFGGHAVNLAAITGAITTGPEAGEDRSRRWIAGVTTGVVYLILGLGAAIATSLLGSAPPLLIEAGAGLALLGAFASGLTNALQSPETRMAAVVTFLVVASGPSWRGSAARSGASSRVCSRCWCCARGAEPDRPHATVGACPSP